MAKLIDECFIGLEENEIICQIITRSYVPYKLTICGIFVIKHVLPDITHDFMNLVNRVAIVILRYRRGVPQHLTLHCASGNYGVTVARYTP